MARKHHPAEVAACLAAVRHALASVQARGVATDAIATDAVQLVARWLGGAALDEGELLRMSGAVADAATIAFKTDRARGWACTVAGNLVWMAAKERGWADATRTILDAATIAISSCDAALSGAEVAAEVEAVFARALEEALAAPPTKAKSPKSPLSRAPDLSPVIGPLAQAVLRRLSPRVDRRKRADAEELAARLAERGLPAWPCVLGFDDVFGGLVMCDAPGRDGVDWTVGAFAATEVGLVAPEGLVMIAMSPNDVEYAMDAEGRVWAQDGIEDPEPVLFARDGVTAMAKILLFTRVWLARGQGVVEDREGAVGTEVAGALGVGGIAEASDAYSAFWGDDAVVVVEQEGNVMIARER